MTDVHIDRAGMTQEERKALLDRMTKGATPKAKRRHELAVVRPRTEEENTLIGDFKAHICRVGKSWKGQALAWIRAELTQPPK